MKFNPTWQQIALIGVVFAAIIGSNIYAPGAFSTITSLASVIVSFLVGTSSTKPLDAPKPEDSQ